VCVCVCVCWGKIAFVVKCDVSGSGSFEELLRRLEYFRHGAVLCGLHNVS